VSNIRKTLISLAFFLFFISLISIAKAQTEITDCTTITSPGEYRLVNDIIDSSASTCINIQANDVVLDCQGYTIDGVYSTNSYGIYIYQHSNITIKNCIVTNWYNGVYLYSSNSNTLLNITANSNAYSGIFLRSSSSNILSNIITNSNYYGIDILVSNSNTLLNITANSNDYGILLSSSNSNTLLNITANSNGYGIYLINLASSNTIENSVIRSNSRYGIYLYSVGNNLIYNNLLNNAINFQFSGTVYTNYWNTTLQPGTNIWNSSLGYIGGNLWTNPSNNGYSDTCVDANYDGFCDQPYDLLGDGSNIDYLPLAKYVGQNVPSFSVVFNYNSVDFGTVTPNTIAEAKSINYNVSITSSSDYKVSVNATDWSGATTIPANTLYFAVNDTLDKLSFATAKQLSNAVQLVATFPSSVTTNYHAFYFNVPVVPVGTYTATVTITYEVV
jgi:parallel beta-helix repeat protein